MGLIRERGRICQVRVHGWGLIREWGLNRSFTVVYPDYASSFTELLEKDNSTSYTRQSMGCRHLLRMKSLLKMHSIIMT